MSHALWIVKKNQCCVLIKKISEHYGGDDVEWLRDYAREVIHANQDDIQKVLNCLWELEAELRWTPRRKVLYGTMEKGLSKTTSMAEKREEI